MQISLLEHLAARQGVFISDLSRNRYSRGAALVDMLYLDEKEFSFGEWTAAITYLYDKEITFTTIEQVKDYIRKGI